MPVFNLMSVLVWEMLIIRINEVANFKNHFIWYLFTFPFNNCSILVECYRSCTVKFFLEHTKTSSDVLHGKHVVKCYVLGGIEGVLVALTFHRLFNYLKFIKVECTIIKMH